MPNVAPTPPSAKGESTELIRLPITCIRTDGGTQPRGRLDDATVERYAGDMRDGIWDWSRSSTPIVGFYDGTDHWCGDGFHRIAAAKAAGLVEVEVEVRPGTLREAKWFSFSVNAEHGYARGRDDVARILQAIFADEEWRTIPLREIARHIKVDEKTVRRHYEKASAAQPQMPKPAARTVTRGGTTYEMDTAKIGRAEPTDPPLDQHAEQMQPLEPMPERIAITAAAGLAHAELRRHFVKARKGEPRIPSRHLVAAMTGKQRDDLRHRAEQLRDWATRLIEALAGDDTEHAGRRLQ